MPGSAARSLSRTSRARLDACLGQPGGLQAAGGEQPVDQPAQPLLLELRQAAPAGIASDSGSNIAGTA